MIRLNLSYYGFRAINVCNTGRRQLGKGVLLTLTKPVSVNNCLNLSGEGNSITDLMR